MVWLRALNINNFVSYAFFSSLSLSDVCGCCIYLLKGLDCRFRAAAPPLESWSRWMRFLCAHTNLIPMAEPMRCIPREIFKIDLSSANLTARIFQMDSSAAFNENPLSNSLEPFIQRSICEIFEKECKKRDDGQEKREETWSMKYILFYIDIITHGP